MITSTAASPIQNPPRDIKLQAGEQLITPENLRKIDIDVGDDPQRRLQLIDGFFQRNPGFFESSDVTRGARQLLERTPGIERIAKWFTPTALGYGQLIHDQVQWQIDTKRQPDNAWWLKMNRRLITDPLEAEAYIRAGRRDEITTVAQKAWAKFIDYSDRSRAALNLPIDYSYPAAGEAESTSVEDAQSGVSALDRLKVQFMYKPLARKALWDAHMRSLEQGRDESKAAAQIVQGKWPKEAEFGSGWANVVGIYAPLNPPATGHQAVIAQRYVLPGLQPANPETMTKAQRAFYRIITALDHHYEREIKTASS